MTSFTCASQGTAAELPAAALSSPARSAGSGTVSEMLGPPVTSVLSAAARRRARSRMRGLQEEGGTQCGGLVDSRGLGGACSSNDASAPPLPFSPPHL